MAIDAAAFAKKHGHWIWPSAIFTAAACGYVPLLGKTITVGDSSEFVTAAATLGIPHPSGYPLYVLLAHAFTWIPFGTVAWKVSFFSALCAALAVAVAFALGRFASRLAGVAVGGLSHPAGMLTMAVLAFSGTWWGAAVFAKSYVLHALLIVCTGFALLRWLERDDGKSAFVMGALFGLSCANHLFLTAVSAPFGIAATVLGLGTVPAGRRLRSFGCMCAGFVAGLVPYAALALMAAAKPKFSFMPIADAEAFWRYVIRADYGDAGIGGANVVAHLASLGTRFLQDLGPVLPLAVVGFCVIATRKKLRPFFVWTIGVLAAPALVAVALRTDWDSVIAHDYSSFALPSMAVAAMLGGIGAASIARHFATHRSAVQALILAPAAVFAVFAAHAAHANVVAYKNPFVDAMARQTLTLLPERAVLINCKIKKARDTASFALAYMQIVEGIRPDVTVIGGGLMRTPLPLLPDGYHAMGNAREKLATLIVSALADPALNDRPIFTLCAPEPIVPGVSAVATGTSFELARGNAELSSVAPPSIPRFDEAGAAVDLRSAVADSLYVEASRLAEVGDADGSAAMLLDASRIDPHVVNDAYLGYVAHASAVRNRVASQ